MIYHNLKLPSVAGRPFFYTNFVATIDGKVSVRERGRGYWPIGSPTDYETLVRLRTYADVLIHGATTAQFTRTIDNLGKPEFQAERRRLGNTKDIIYAVVSTHPGSIVGLLASPPPGTRGRLVTTTEAPLPSEVEGFEVMRCGEKSVDVSVLSRLLYEEGVRHVLVEGGPQLLGGFLEAGLVDEVFLTIAPKIFGNKLGEALTMVEGVLFSPEEVKRFKLLSVEQVEDEVYLRYSNAASPVV